MNHYKIALEKVLDDCSKIIKEAEDAERKAMWKEAERERGTMSMEEHRALVFKNLKKHVKKNYGHILKVVEVVRLACLPRRPFRFRVEVLTPNGLKIYGDSYVNGTTSTYYAIKELDESLGRYK